MAVSVNDLCTVNFANRPILEQLRIVALGRPLSQNIFTKASTKVPAMTPHLFEEVHWLTFNEEWGGFFCWPCLLFMPQFSNIKILTRAALKDVFEVTNRHEMIESHLTCSLKLQMFISENFPPPVSTQDKVGHNYAVKKNRDVLKCIIDAVCCVVGQTQLDRDGKYSFNLISIEDCKNFLQLLKDCNPRKADVVDDAVDLLSSNPRILNQLVDAMTRSVKMSIKNETKKSTYVSIIFSQRGSSNVKSQMSTILRYINGGKVCERFIGFTNYVGIKTRDQLIQCILKPIEEYDIADRFLALSLDGDISYGQSLSLLTTAVSAKYRFSYFVPWYSHGFGYVLLKSLSVYRECGYFLKMISGMQEFFRDEKHFKSLEVLLRLRVPDYIGGVKWNLHSNFVVYVAKYRCCFIEFFQNVLCNSRCQRNGVVAQASAFRAFLEKFRNVFLLKLFHEIFHADFDETFNFPLRHKAFNWDRICLFKRKVNQINLATIMRALVSEAKREKALKFAVNNATELKKCEVLFMTVIKHLCYEFDVRCVHLSTRLGFCDLFDVLRDCPAEDVFNFNEHFHRLLRQLMVEHGQFFCASELRIEMNAIKSNPDMRAKTGHELLEHFARYNLRGLFPQSYKLVELILTLPYLPASPQKGGVSKLEDVRKFSYFPEGFGIPSGEVSFLSVECELLRSLTQSPPFYDDVLARFYEVNKTIPLVQI